MCMCILIKQRDCADMGNPPSDIKMTYTNQYQTMLLVLFGKDWLLAQQNISAQTL